MRSRLQEELEQEELMRSKLQELAGVARTIGLKCAQKHKTVRAAWQHLDSARTGAVTVTEVERLCEAFALPDDVARRFFFLLTDIAGTSTIRWSHFNEVIGPMIQPGHKLTPLDDCDPELLQQLARGYGARRRPQTARARPASARGRRPPAGISSAAGNIARVLRTNAKEHFIAEEPWVTVSQNFDRSTETEPEVISKDHLQREEKSCDSIGSASTAASPTARSPPSCFSAPSPAAGVKGLLGSSSVREGKSAGGKSAVLNSRRCSTMTAVQSSNGCVFGFVPDEPRTLNMSVLNMTFDSSMLASRVFPTRAGPSPRPLSSPMFATRPKTGPARRPSGSRSEPGPGRASVCSA